jgi:ABC-type sugar transport system permease subunit
MKMKSTADRIFDIFNIAFMILVIFAMLYPLYFTVIASISEPNDVAAGNVFIVPKGFTLNAYKYILQNKEIWSGYRNTIFYTVFGTLMGLFLTIPAAYVLSKSIEKNKELYEINNKYTIIYHKYQSQPGESVKISLLASIVFLFAILLLRIAIEAAFFVPTRTNIFFALVMHV